MEASSRGRERGRNRAQRGGPQSARSSRPPGLLENKGPEPAEATEPQFHTSSGAQSGGAEEMKKKTPNTHPVC